MSTSPTAVTSPPHTTPHKWNSLTPFDPAERLTLLSWTPGASRHPCKPQSHASTRRPSVWPTPAAPLPWRTLGSLQPEPPAAHRWGSEGEKRKEKQTWEERQTRGAKDQRKVKQRGNWSDGSSKKPKNQNKENQLQQWRSEKGESKLKNGRKKHESKSEQNMQRKKRTSKMHLLLEHKGK